MRCRSWADVDLEGVGAGVTFPRKVDFLDLVSMSVFDRGDVVLVEDALVVLHVADDEDVGHVLAHADVAEESELAGHVDHPRQVDHLGQGRLLHTKDHIPKSVVTYQILKIFEE